MTALGGTELTDALALLHRLQAGGGVRELVALSIRVDSWLDPVEVIAMPSGGSWPEPGYRLPWPDEEAARWMLPEARLLVLGREAAAEPLVLPFTELEAQAGSLAVALRRALIEEYLADLGLLQARGTTLQRSLADLLALARATDPATRGQLLGSLHRSMAERREEWGMIAVHLRSGFETALADREPSCYEPAVSALVELALLGPFPPPAAGDPRRILEVLFRVPRPEVRTATMRKLAAQPDEILRGVAAQVAPHARLAIAHESPAVRHAAGELELRLAALDAEAGAGSASDKPGGDAATALRQTLGDLGSVAAYRRARALREIGDRAREMPALLPRLLDALDDSDAEVRAEACKVVRPLLDSRSAAVRERTLAALIRSRDAAVVRTGIDALGLPLSDVDESVAESLLLEALDGPEGAREPATVHLAALFSARPATAAAQGFGKLLRHTDPVVRLVALRVLARDAADRPPVRDALTHDLMARLEDREPGLRVATLRTLARLGHPGVADIGARLAGDPDPLVRQGALEVLGQLGDGQALSRGEQIGRDVEALYDLAHDGGGDARIRWARALSDLIKQDPPELPRLLLGLLKTVPPDSGEPFLRFVLAEVDRELLSIADRAPGGLAGLCRRLVEPPDPRPEHAARLAATSAAEDPLLFDLLWTMATIGSGTASEAARRALSSLPGHRVSDAVRAAAGELWAKADDGERDVLRTLLGRAPR
jgi:hypothetical protein